MNSVLKFGGTSMGDAQSWQRVLKIINQYDHPFVVVSATAKTTRQLIAAAEEAQTDREKAFEIAENIRSRHHQIVLNFIDDYREADADVKKECKRWIDDQISELKSRLADIHSEGTLSARMKDSVASTGERLSSYLFARCGTIFGLPTSWADAGETIRTDSEFGQANPDTEEIRQNTARLLANLGPEQIPVMGGYYGKDAEGNVTTLGFEGSDYSASLIGAAIEAETIEIWTDVSGVYTCDPRHVSRARPIPQLSYQEAAELAYFGAKVLHPFSTKPASAQNIPIRVKNIFEPVEPGTLISSESTEKEEVKAITFKDNCMIITVSSSNTVMGYEFLSGVFDTLRWHHLPVDVVTTTEASVSIAIENGERALKAAEQLTSYGSVETKSGQGVISLVGCRGHDPQGLIKRVLGCMESSSVHLLSFSRSKGNMNVALDKKRLHSSVQEIHQELFE